MVDWWWLVVVFYAGVAVGAALTRRKADQIAGEVEAWLEGKSEWN